MAKRKRKKNDLKKYLPLLLLLLIVAFAFVYFSANDEGSSNTTVCAQDVYECPDGTFLSRDPDNNCEFPVCPEVQDENNEEDTNFSFDIDIRTI